MCDSARDLSLRLRSQNISYGINDYAYFKKCGDITASPDEKSFGLNCVFCPVIAWQFEVFIEHVRTEHSEDIKALYTSDNKLLWEQTSRNHSRTDDELMIEENNENDYLDTANVPKGIDTDWNEIGVELTEQRQQQKKQQLPLLLQQQYPKLILQSEISKLESNEKESENSIQIKHFEEQEEDDLNCCLVYIMEERNSSTDEMLMEEEETVDSFKMFNDINDNDKQNNNDIITIDVGSIEEVSQYNTETKVGDKKINGNSSKSFSFKNENATFMTNAEIGQRNEKVACTKRKIKNVKMREVLRNKEIISYLLEAYKNNEKLWNPKHPDYKYNARRCIFNELSGPLFRDMNCTLTGVEIFAILKDLRVRYRRDLTKFKTRKGKYKSKLWYFDKLDFLRDVIEHRRAERAAKLKQEMPEPVGEDNCEKSKVVRDREVLYYILGAYKRQEILWNPKHPGYFSCNKLEQFNDIAAQLKEDLNVDLSGEDCSAEMQKLRIRYRKELHVLNKCKGLYIPKLWCFDQMEFLREALDNQMLKHLSKRKNILGSTPPKTSYLKADSIPFNSSEDQLIFIEVYKNYTALWNVDHPDYRSSTYRLKALNQMLEEINKTFELQVTIDELQKTIYQFRKDYSNMKQKMLMNAGNSIEDHLDVENAINEIYFKLTEFLNENVGPFRCDVCNEYIRTSDKYKVHKSTHDGTLPFICTLCGKGFQMPGNLTVHIRRHKRDFPYSCGVCDKSFATSTEVTIHMRSHTGERPYICDLCGKSFKTWSFFDIHRRAHLQQSNFLCPICDKAFYEKNRFTDHMNGHLNIRKHACKECGKRFTTFANLKKHNELHLEVKKYKCLLCGNRFAQFASLRWHKRTTHENVQCESNDVEQ